MRNAIKIGEFLSSDLLSSFRGCRFDAFLARLEAKGWTKARVGLGLDILPWCGSFFV